MLLSFPTLIPSSQWILFCILTSTPVFNKWPQTSRSKRKTFWWLPSTLRIKPTSHRHPDMQGWLLTVLQVSRPQTQRGLSHLIYTGPGTLLHQIPLLSSVLSTIWNCLVHLCSYCLSSSSRMSATPQPLFWPLLYDPYWVVHHNILPVYILKIFW